jgi:hypothetical protein
MHVLFDVALGADTFAGKAFYVGDPHAHTGLSQDAGASDLGGCPDGGCGAIADVFDSARAAGLDWVALSDHVNDASTADPDAWEAFLGRALAEDDADLVVVPAAEIWLALGADAFLGHLSFLAFGTDEQLAGLTMEEVQPTGTELAVIEDCRAIGTFMEDFAAARGPALAIPHHPALERPKPWDWTCASPAWAPAVEVYSEHGNSMGDGTGWDPPWSGEVTDGTVHAAIGPDGFALKLGFIAGSDAHDTWPGRVCDVDAVRTSHPYAAGLTMVVLDEGVSLDRAAIGTAMVERRTYGTSGPALPVALTWSAGGALLGEMGDDLEVPAGASLGATASVPEEMAAFVLGMELVTPTRRVTMGDRGAGAWTASLAGDEQEEWAYVAVRIDGAAWWGGACDDGGDDDVEWAWLSPSWISAAPATRSRACGCSTSRTAGAALLAGAAMTCLRRRG